LRVDLADDLRRWAADRSSIGPLFRLSANLVKTFDRDLRYAGIAKRDERGGTACVHSLRHAFATMLSRAGVAPRVVQAALRHASPEFSMRNYVDPIQLDVGAALGVLPALPLTPTVLAPAGADPGVA
jgi:integrase